MKFKEFKKQKLKWKRSYGTICLKDEQKSIAQKEAKKFLKLLNKNGIAGILRNDDFGDPEVTFEATIKEICKLSDKLGIELNEITIMSYKRSVELLKETE